MTASRCACARVDGSLGSCPGPHGAAGALEHGRRPDALADGRPLRRLTVVDPWRRQSPLLEATARQSGVTISAAPDRSGSRSCANHKHRLPRDEVSGAGSGGLGLSPQGGSSASCAPDAPLKNAFIAAFHGRLCAACLNVHQFHGARGCPRHDRSLACRLQSPATTQLARSPDAEPARRATSGVGGRRRRYGSLVTTCHPTGPTSSSWALPDESDR